MTCRTFWESTLHQSTTGVVSVVIPVELPRSGPGGCHSELPWEIIQLVGLCDLVFVNLHDSLMDLDSTERSCHFSASILNSLLLSPKTNSLNPETRVFFLSSAVFLAYSARTLISLLKFRVFLSFKIYCLVHGDFVGFFFLRIVTAQSVQIKMLEFLHNMISGTTNRPCLCVWVLWKSMSLNDSVCIYLLCLVLSTVGNMLKLFLMISVWITLLKLVSKDKLMCGLRKKKLYIYIFIYNLHQEGRV